MGVRSREWTAVAPTELGVIRELAGWLRLIRGSRVPEEPGLVPERRHLTPARTGIHVCPDVSPEGWGKRAWMMLGSGKLTHSTKAKPP